MAVEDAAVLGNILSNISHISQLTPMLRAYEALRHARTSATQASSRLNQKIFHLPDGPEQERRDTEMRAAMAAEHARLAARERRKAEGKDEFADDGMYEQLFEGNSNQWADRAKNIEQFSYDADSEAERWWVERGQRVCELALKNAENSAHDGLKVAARL